ncbi:MAG: InlB B-repeat-containing protein [Lachnospiraceae bacterium]|jgi:hypothetical protein|nr:InlB B-repeat-containing protein [Lachnospiraceae bacterium]
MKTLVKSKNLLFKKILVMLLIATFLVPSFPIGIKKVEAASAGQISYAMKYNAGNPEKWTFTNVSVGSLPSGAVGYSSMNIMYPKKFNMHYVIPSGWDIHTSEASNSDYKSISIHFSTENSANIQNFFTNSSTYFTLANSGDYPSTTTSKIQVSLDTVSTAQYIDSNGVPHWYKCIPDETSTWYQAFNKSRNMSYNGIKGHLATLTSIEEQYFLYKTISTLPGWLGGTRAIFGSNGAKISTQRTGNISESLSNYSHSSSQKMWYWADGPEAGLEFYNGPSYNSSGLINGVFSFFSNPGTYNAYYNIYQNDLPINPVSEPNSTSSEYCLQFAQEGKSSWNDIPADYTGYALKCYYVEFTGTAADLEDSSVFESPVYIPVPLKVSFNIQNSDYTSSIANQMIWEGNKATDPTANTLVPGNVYSQYGGKKFTGWYTDAAATKTYDFNTNITKDITIYGGWKVVHNITSKSGLHGSLSENGTIVVEDGTSLEIKMLPDTGYHPSEVLVDGNDVGQVMSYTFANIKGDHSIDVSFATNDVVVKVDKDSNPWANSGKNLILHDTNEQAGSGNIALNANSDNSYGATLIPNGTYDVLEGNKDTGKQVVVKDNSPSAVTVNYYTFTSSAGEGGGITGTPSGSIFLPGEQVTVGADVFKHYTWNTWTLTGAGASSLGLVDTSKQTISFSMPEGEVNAAASFIHITWKINAFAGANGSVFPDGETTMFDGTDLPITITPDTGYHVEKVIVDGLDLGEIYNYTFANIIANGILQAEFTPNTVKIEVTKDGEIWPNSGKELYLHLAGNEEVEPIKLDVDIDSEDENGYITKEIPNGIYEIYEGELDTGETVTVMNNNPDTVVVSLHVITTTAGENGEIIPTVYEGNKKDENNNSEEGENSENEDKSIEQGVENKKIGRIVKQSENKLLRNLSGEVIILQGYNQSFDIVPEKGHHVDEVYINGEYSGYETSYKFENVQESQTLDATFMPDDQDTDGDKVPDYIEREQGTDEENKEDYKDIDGDRVPDYVEEQDKTNSESKDDYKDSDGDKVPDYVEEIEGTNPNKKDDYKDSDGDEIPDYIEIRQGTDPKDKKSILDTDKDGVPDYVEEMEGTNPKDPKSFLDSDGGGLSDYAERMKGSDPHNASDDKPKKSKVKTGDTNDTTPLGIVFLLSILGFGIMLDRKKKFIKFK